MNKPRTIAALFLTLSFFWSPRQDAIAGNPQTEAKLRGALGNFQALTPETLRDPANADLLEELRSLATNTDLTAARVPLIKLGDETVIRSCLKMLDSEERNSAIAQLVMAANPKVIALLESDLNREENPEKIRVSHDVWRSPVSMNAALIVKRIVLKSPAFSAEVKEWARALPSFSAGLRVGIRAWWETNKAALLREDYGAVVPPR